jgi:hypothetical protein
MSLFTDYITVLSVRYPRDAVMTKRLYRAANSVIDKSDYDNAIKFDVQKIGINDLADLCGVLFDVSKQPNKVAIRGLPITRHYDVYRRLHGDQAAFAADPDGHHWLFADFDEVPLPIFLDPDDDPEIILGYLVRLLPHAFHSTSFYWQWSCGHGLDRRSLRAHLFFWCSGKHTDREYENWAKWINGEAGWKILDPAVCRTVQPNYVAAPILGEGVDDPVPTGRNGIHVGETQEVSLDIPTLDWDDRVRQQERQECAELAEYGLRPPPGGLPPVHPGDRYLDYLEERIGDDKDGYHEPMQKAIWHWAKAYPESYDEDFKEALRAVVRSAKCTKQRDLEVYLSDYRLDTSLRGAREKQPTATRPTDALARYRSKIRLGLSHSRKG